MEHLDYNKDLEFDKFNLDEEVKQHSVLYMRYQTLYLQKKQEVDDAKLKIDVMKDQLKSVEADLYLKFKSEKVEGKSPTEGQVNARVVIDKLRYDAYKELTDFQKEFNKMVYEMGILEAVVKSFESRKKMIEKEVEMVIFGYFSSPQKRGDDIRNKLNKRD